MNVEIWGLYRARVFALLFLPCFKRVGGHEYQGLQRTYRDKMTIQRDRMTKIKGQNDKKRGR